MDEQFLFTIVMPTYNVEKYIDEAIHSVLQQDIGFEEYAQLIIVDDGTPDKSGEIAESYARKYPNNITVIHKKNGGLSSARNAGVKVATGKYISFLDPDDTYDLNVLSKVRDFYEKHDSETDIVSFPVYYFENREGGHILNYKYENGTRVIDLNEEWDAAQHFLTSAFIRTSVAKELCFKEDLNMSVSEDAREVVTLLINRCKLGVIDDTKYNYRWRSGSQMSVSQNDKRWYFNYLDNFVDYFLNQFDGPVPKFVQFTLFYNIQWRILLKEIPENVLTPEEKNEYFNRIMNTIISFDDDIILAQRNIKTEYKAFILYKKHKAYPSIIETEKGLYYSFNQDEIIRYISKFNLHLNYFGVQNNKLKIEGWYAYAKYLSEEPVTPLLILEDNTIVSPTLKKPINGKVSFDEIINYKIPFEFNLDILELNKLQFAYDTPKGIELCKRVVIDTPFFIPESERKEFVKNRYKFKLNSDKTISIEKL